MTFAQTTLKQICKKHTYLCAQKLCQAVYVKHETFIELKDNDLLIRFKISQHYTIFPQLQVK